MPPRATTPPRGSRGGADGAGQSLTPEQVRIMQENRLKAKAMVQERDRKQRERVFDSAQSTNQAGKRPLVPPPPLQRASFDSTSPTAPASRTYPSRTTSAGTTNASSALQNAVASGSGTSNADASGSGQKHFLRADDPSVPLRNMIGQYVEYDLATLKNSKGGFLVADDEDDPRKLKEMKLMEENKRKRLENLRKQGLLHDATVSLDPREQPKCAHCGSSDLDQQIQTIFGVFVCAKCKSERPDQYSLLTKTECKEDYLLTDPELKDEELLPHLLRPNPHRPTYSNMMLFLRMQVEAFAFSDRKWGSPEALDAEFERREAEKKEKKSKKFEKKLKELRKKTRTNVWHRRTEGEHRHVFGEGEGEDGVQRCEECGFEVEVEVF